MNFHSCIYQDAEVLLNNFSIWKRKKFTKEMCEQFQLIQSRFDSLHMESSEVIHRQKQFIAQLEESLSEKDECISSFASQLEQLDKERADLARSHEDIVRRHLSQSEKFQLLSGSLALEPAHNKDFEEFSRLITEDYMAFAAGESSLAEEAHAVLELHNILDTLRLVVNFPYIAGKKVLAIAGGFSSGKSAFINSFIENTGVRLSTGINPVTIVPSYVACSDDVCIKIHAPNGGCGELDQEIYARMSHEYVNGFGFDLRKILPFISVTAPMKKDFFQHICIVDTPGYNPGADCSILSGDKHSAAALVGQATAMIWMIGLDPAGTISQTDIDFIAASNISGDDLYIVLNKADVKALDDIADIMQQVADDLDFYGIEYAGICAYSSLNTNQDYGHFGKTLDDFLVSINCRANVFEYFSQRIDGVFQQYEVALSMDKEKLIERKNVLRKIQIFALEHGGTELYENFNREFQHINLDPEIYKLTEFIRHEKEIQNKLKSCLEKVLSNLGLHH